MISGGVGGMCTSCLRLSYQAARPLRAWELSYRCRLFATTCSAADKKEKVIVISGPTGSGKSRLALELAKRLNGEIISADSVQVYRGLDVGSAKPLLSERKVYIWKAKCSKSFSRDHLSSVLRACRFTEKW